MEKIGKKLKEISIILLVVLIILAGFFGVFVKEKGIWQNKIPDYQYGMDVGGARELRYGLKEGQEEKFVYVDENGNIKGEVWEEGKPTTAEQEASSEEGQAAQDSQMENSYKKEKRTIKTNSDEKLTKENFEMAKKIIQQRFKNQEIGEYAIRIDDVTGKLSIELPNQNETVTLAQSLMGQVGKFEIIDYQNGIVLMDNSAIDNVSVVSSNEGGYRAYLQIELNKQGAQKLLDISKEYVEIKKEEQEGTEEHEHEEESTKKYVSIAIDGTTIMSTYFGEEMAGGILQIPIGQQRTQYEEFVTDYESARLIANILNSGMLPVVYELETDNFVASELNLQNIKIVVAILLILILVIFTIKFKKNGILAAILGTGYIALLLIVFRYTNVVLTVNSLLAFGIIVFMNFLFMKLLLKKMKEQEAKQSYAQTMRKFYLMSIPVMVIAIVFTLSKYVVINSVGMVLFWGMIFMAIYHVLITRTIFIKK